jgi:hypothetical protein
MQLLGQFGKRRFAINRHIGYNVALDNIVLVSDALDIVAWLDVKKFSK